MNPVVDMYTLQAFNTPDKADLFIIVSELTDEP